ESDPMNRSTKSKKSSSSLWAVWETRAATPRGLPRPFRRGFSKRCGQSAPQRRLSGRPPSRRGLSTPRHRPQAGSCRRPLHAAADVLGLKRDRVLVADGLGLLEAEPEHGVAEWALIAVVEEPHREVARVGVDFVEGQLAEFHAADRDPACVGCEDPA